MGTKIGGKKGLKLQGEVIYNNNKKKKPFDFIKNAQSKNYLLVFLVVGL